MAFTLTRLNKNIDRMCQYYERLRGVDGASAYGFGEDGNTYLSAGAIEDLRADIVAAADTDELAALLVSVNQTITSTSAVKVATEKLRSIMVRNESLVRALAVASGVTTIETYLAYYNTGAGGTFTALQAPQWRELHYQWKRAYPAISNLYFEIIQGGSFRGTTYTNALGKFVASGAGTGSFTNGDVVDYTKYAGGTGKINMSGITGSGNVTITGLGWNPATGAVTASSTWITSVTGNGLTTVTVGAGTAPANCLLVDVTNITIAAGISAGTLYVEAHKPASRLAVPF